MFLPFVIVVWFALFGRLLFGSLPFFISATLVLSSWTVFYSNLFPSSVLVAFPGAWDPPFLLSVLLSLVVSSVCGSPEQWKLWGLLTYLHNVGILIFFDAFTTNNWVSLHYQKKTIGRVCSELAGVHTLARTIKCHYS